MLYRLLLPFLLHVTLCHMIMMSTKRCCLTVFALLPFGVWEHKKKDFQPLLQRCCCFCCCCCFSMISFQTKYSSKQWILIADGYFKAALDSVLLYGISLLSVSLSVSLYCKYLLFQTLNQYRLLYFGSFGFVEFNLYIRQRPKQMM